MELERGRANAEALPDISGGRFAKRLSEICMGDQGMEKSMELDMGDLPAIHDVKEIKEDNDNNNAIGFQDRVCLSTVFENEDEGGEERRSSVEDCEVYKEVVEESTRRQERRDDAIGIENANDARKTRIQNIFRLCGNYRELAQQVNKVRTPSSSLSGLSDENKPAELESFRSASSSSETPQDSKESCRADGQVADGTTEVCVKWEASKESTGNIIKKLKVSKDCGTLSDLRKLIEVHLEGENEKQSFVFLLLGDPSGAPVSKEQEATVPVCKLPVCNTRLSTHLACLRPIKKPSHRPPFGSLENTVPLTGRVYLLDV